LTTRGTVSRVLKVLDRALSAVEISVILVTGVAIVSALFYGAIVRYLLHGSFPEEAELSWLMYTWLVFLGSSYVLRGGDHPNVTLIRGRFGARYAAALYLVSLAYVVLILYQTLQYSRIFLLQRTATMRLPMAYFYGAMVVGFTFMAVRYVMKLVRLFLR
jgi:TRAP-type C4-dicarboxylate transport system permease small subunit